jgi:hypothetical protein
LSVFGFKKVFPEVCSGSQGKETPQRHRRRT